MLTELENVSGMNREEAKSLLITEMKEEAKAEALNMIKQIEQDAKMKVTKSKRNSSFGNSKVCC